VPCAGSAPAGHESPADPVWTRWSEMVSRTGAHYSFLIASRQLASTEAVLMRALRRIAGSPVVAPRTPASPGSAVLGASAVEAGRVQRVRVSTGPSARLLKMIADRGAWASAALAIRPLVRAPCGVGRAFQPAAVLTAVSVRCRLRSSVMDRIGGRQGRFAVLLAAVAVVAALVVVGASSSVAAPAPQYFVQHGTGNAVTFTAQDLSPPAAGETVSVVFRLDPGAGSSPQHYQISNLQPPAGYTCNVDQLPGATGTTTIGCGPKAGTAQTGPVTIAATADTSPAYPNPSTKSSVSTCYTTPTQPLCQEQPMTDRGSGGGPPPGGGGGTPLTRGDMFEFKLAWDPVGPVGSGPVAHAAHGSGSLPPVEYVPPAGHELKLNGSESEFDALCAQRWANRDIVIDSRF
jgi:hypothetical protein